MNREEKNNLVPVWERATITLEEALDLFKLPRTLGEYEGNDGRADLRLCHVGWQQAND